MADPWRPDSDQGVFETVLTVDGCPVELEAHLARLDASLGALFPDRIAPDPRAEIEEHAADAELASIRVTVSPAGAAELQAKAEKRSAPGSFFPLSGNKAPIRQVALRTLTLPGGLGRHKWADRSLLDEAQARLPADSLPLIVDTAGAALEASRASVFAVRNGALFTPPLDGRILPGITRMRVLEIAAARGLEAEEIALSRADLLAADEVFLTGSVRGIEPVASLDGAALPGSGPIAAELAAGLRRAWLGAPVA